MYHFPKPFRKETLNSGLAQLLSLSSPHWFLLLVWILEIHWSYLFGKVLSGYGGVEGNWLQAEPRKDQDHGTRTQSSQSPLSSFLSGFLMICTDILKVLNTPTLKTHKKSPSFASGPWICLLSASPLFVYLLISLCLPLPLPPPDLGPPDPEHCPCFSSLSIDLFSNSLLCCWLLKESGVVESLNSRVLTAWILISRHLLAVWTWESKFLICKMGIVPVPSWQGWWEDSLSNHM